MAAGGGTAVAAPPAVAATAESAAAAAVAPTAADCSPPMVASGLSAASSRPRFIGGRRDEEEEWIAEEARRVWERTRWYGWSGRGRGFSTRFGEEMHCSCLLELPRRRGCRFDLTHPPGRPHSTWGRGGHAGGGGLPSIAIGLTSGSPCHPHNRLK